MAKTTKMALIAIKTWKRLPAWLWKMSGHGKDNQAHCNRCQDMARTTNIDCISYKDMTTGMAVIVSFSRWKRDILVSNDIHHLSHSCCKGYISSYWVQCRGICLFLWVNGDWWSLFLNIKVLWPRQCCKILFETNLLFKYAIIFTFWGELQYSSPNILYYPNDFGGLAKYHFYQCYIE